MIICALGVVLLALLIVDGLRYFSIFFDPLKHLDDVARIAAHIKRGYLCDSNSHWRVMELLCVCARQNIQTATYY